ncbi:hypothetical protein HFO02_36360 [Rhizobium laguerreae]|uniref:hypothetical protein n=1 Tax=Rhizobium laguerreae TaxID=1076926 RepID=UPI001C911891|nr:hypothetical protein [Rhizobium laguerreae]MBY3328948.1 hypothetical protein [Rhizobium laguerreae]
MSSIMRRRSGLISVIVISCSKVGLKQPNSSNQKRIMQIRAPNAAQAASFNQLAEVMYVEPGILL